MKLSQRLVALFLATFTCFSTFVIPVSAKKFAKKINTNLGVSTQYAYDENNPSWLRQLVIKENMLSVGGIVNEKPLYPVTSYPYTTDAENFKDEVNEYVKLYTLDEESQKAAYIYIFQQIGALSIIADPEATDKSKADWLRSQGIIITPEEEQDPNSIIMISALYALMKNDFYYVFTGDRLSVPAGTRLEPALMMYLVALDGDDNSLLLFIEKYFNISSIISLDDYVYYTCLLALYTNGFVSSREIVTVSRDEVFRRTAIMAINNAGLSVDMNNATTEEIQIKYMAAMMGTQYDLTLDPDSLFKANRSGTVPYYILQKMAYEDASISIQKSKYTYEQAFDIVLKRTNRFDLEKKFYSDIYEYDVRLDYFRDHIYLNPTPIETADIQVLVNDRKIPIAQYETLSLNSEAKQTFFITVNYSGKDKRTTNYKINVYQGENAAPNDENDLTGIVSNIASPENSPNYTIPPSVDYLNPSMPQNNQLGGQVQLLHINENGQLVDSQGNVISDAVPESLPDGYGYILNPNGVITIGKLDSVETTADGVTSKKNIDKRQVQTILIYFSSFLVLAAAISGFIYYRITVKKRKTKSSNLGNKKKKKNTKKSK